MCRCILHRQFVLRHLRCLADDLDFLLSRIDSIMGGFLLRKKQAFQGSGAKAPPFLRYASELACASPYNPCHKFKIENETVN